MYIIVVASRMAGTTFWVSPCSLLFFAKIAVAAFLLYSSPNTPVNKIPDLGNKT